MYQTKTAGGFRKMAICTTVAATFACTGVAQAASMRFASTGIGSSWYAIAAGISDLSKSLTPDGTEFEVLPIAGTRGNLKLVQNGEAEFGLTFPMPAKDACAGTGWVDGKYDNVRAVAGGLDNFYFAAFVKESSGVDSWEEIAEGKNGFRLLTVKVGGEGEIATGQILAYLGSSKEKVEQAGGSVKPASRTATTQEISDGKADGWAHNAGFNHPVANQLLSLGGMTVLGLPDVVIDGMVNEVGWQPYEIPAGTYEGQNEPLQTITASTNIIVHADVPDDVVYAVTKAVVEKAEALKKIHAALAPYDPKRAADPKLNGHCELHPGAVRYYKEAGML